MGTAAQRQRQSMHRDGESTADFFTLRRTILRDTLSIVSAIEDLNVVRNDKEKVFADVKFFHHLISYRFQISEIQS